MKWFKHYNLASEGEGVGNLLAGRNYAAVTLWWLLLEYVSRFEEENNRGKCSVPLARIARTMNMQQSRVLRLFADISREFCQDFAWNFDETNSKLIQISITNWLKLQENRGGKREAKTEQKPTEVRGKRLEEEERKKEGEGPRAFLNGSDFLEQVPIMTKELWLKDRDAGIVVAELQSMIDYYSAELESKNWPIRTWIRKANAWLSRSKRWEKKGEPATDDWMEKAQRVAKALKSWGVWTSTDQPAVIRFLGDDLFNLAIKAGVYKMRQLPASDFYLRNIIGLLKEAQVKT